MREELERRCDRQPHEYLVKIINGERLILHSLFESDLISLKSYFSGDTHNKIRGLTFEWVKEPRHCLVCGLPGWQILQGFRCVCDQTDPYLKDKPAYESWEESVGSVQHYW